MDLSHRSVELVPVQVEEVDSVTLVLDVELHSSLMPATLEEGLPDRRRELHLEPDVSSLHALVWMRREAPSRQ
jgi:hypothetical protein